MSIFKGIILLRRKGGDKLNISIAHKANKGFRLLSIYERLNKGEIIEKEQLAKCLGVTQKTIQRDIEDLRAYITEVHFTEGEVAIKYNKSKNGYYLIHFEREWLTNEEVMALCKILLESRALCKEELDNLINKLLAQVAPNDRKKIKSIIRSEQYHYVPLKHGKYLLSILWELSQLIINNELTKFTYTRQDSVTKEHLVKPVAMMFSEYYFYLIAYMANENKDFPTVFRIDRITHLKGTKQHFSIPYKDRFNEGEFRKRVQFMYSGELKTVTFEFSGPSLEAVLDRLPTAEIIGEKDGVYKIRTEVYGKGIQMWLRSQGDWIKNIEL